MKILITAFLPFDRNNENFSQVVLNRLKVQNNVFTAFLPVEYTKSAQIMQEEIIKYNPDIIIMLGEARTYKSLGFEVIGINEYSERADNANYIPPSRYIVKTGKDGIFSSLDYDLFVKSMNETKTKFHRSFSAGTYVCNTLLYITLIFIEDNALNIKAGFIHIPDLANQNIDEIVSGLENYITKLLAV